MTDDDKALLEAAARAAGIRVQRSRLHDLLNRDMLIENSVRNPHQSAGPWNPLDDDGDALRLAVRLGMAVTVDTVGMVAVADANMHSAGPPFPPAETITDDPYAATRRAIVRAAASMGEAK
jgi:hypothetical protein